ncbi:MAG TPA: O-antigen ligase family protein [Candidatus Methylacidiphilales bacterium]|nr:O-antigen ligase family protein [Candidatus Methylacidiphilales bacterium]
MSPSQKSKNDLSLTRFWIVAITLMALALGGATELGAQTIVAAVTAFILLAAPPRHSLGTWPNILFAAFFILSLSAWLPAAWFPEPLWRQQLTADLQFSLPVTRTPQPYLTTQACALLLIGLVWAYNLLSQRWNRAQRLQAVSLLVLGVAVLASVSVLAYTFGFHIPGWKQEQNRGWFPNRNQTADVLALAGILNYALVVERLRRQDRAGWFWLATLLPIGAALVVSYSRSGIILFFAGIALWHLWPGSQRQSAKQIALSVSLILILLALFLLFGGETLARFQSRPGTDVSHATNVDAGFRLSIQKDALRFSLQAPWLGVGLGNFEALFATARHDSANQSRAVHPESDWLWTACEMGWPAVLLLLAGTGWWLRQCLPFEPEKRGESLRRALVIAVLMFLLHGLVDVPGHRVGSLWFALLLASLALPPSGRLEIPEHFLLTALRPAALFFRGVALLILVVAGWWASSLNANLGMGIVSAGSADSAQDSLGDDIYQAAFRGDWFPPTTAGLAQLHARIADMIAQRQADEVAELTTAALKIAPLDWTLYFQRAGAEVYLPGRLSQAGADFLVARALEPHWPKPCFDEGVIWLAVDQPDLCMDAWQEALRRDPASSHDLFADMMRASEANDLVREDLAGLAVTDTGYLLIFLDNATPKETESIIAHFLAIDPDLKTLSPAQRGTVFADWWRAGDQAALIGHLLDHPEWQKQGWPWLARFYARQKDFPRAWQVIAARAVLPTLPADNTGQALADLERSFYATPDNTAAGLVLLQAELRAGKMEDALDTVRAVEKNPDCPPWLSSYEAQLWAAKQQWELAWDAWSRNDNR